MVQKTDTELQAYIDDLRTHGIRSKAARAAGMQLRTVLKYLAEDTEFAAEDELAQQEAADYLEEAARERAVDGIPHFKMFNGKKVEIKRVYSDTLLSKLLDGALPDKYAQRTKSELSGPGGGNIPLDDTSVAARLSSLMAMAQERKNAALSEEDLLK